MVPSHGTTRRKRHTLVRQPCAGAAWARIGLSLISVTRCATEPGNWETVSQVFARSVDEIVTRLLLIFLFVDKALIVNTKNS